MAYVLWLLLALAGASGGFVSVWTGLVSFPSGNATAEPGAHGQDQTEAMPTGGGAQDTAFVAIDPVTVSLGARPGGGHLRFRAQLEVDAARTEEVTRLMPRIVDVLNGYLRALEITDLSGPLALVRLRAQLLRRFDVVIGGNAVRDLLIMEFVLN